MSQFSANQSVANARILLLVIQSVLESVMKESEEAVMKVTEALNNMSELTESQRKRLSESLEDFYAGSQAEDLKQSLNDSATAIMDAARSGDMASVESIGNSPQYQRQKTKTKTLHDNLQEFMSSSESMGETIMPLLISLQFQDKLKQQLVGVMRALELFIQHDTVVINDTDINFDDFWTKVQKGFNVVETRNAILQIVKKSISGKSA